MADFDFYTWLEGFIGSEPHRLYKEALSTMVKDSIEVLRRPIEKIPEDVLLVERTKGEIDAYERDIFQEMFDQLKETRTPKQEEPKNENAN